MFKNILHSVSGFNTWSIITMIIFFAIFMVVIYIIFTADKQYVDRMSSLPLDNDELNK
jgi:hypothetical protein